MLHQSPTDRSSAQFKAPTPNASNPQTSMLPSSKQTNSPNQFISLQPTSLAESQLSQDAVSTLVSTTFVGSSPSIPSTVLLQTAVVKIVDSYGNHQLARALLDPASQLSLVTENLVQKLKLRRSLDRQEIGGVGNSVIVSHHAVVVRIGSRCSDFVAEVKCHILKQITREMPSKYMDSASFNIPPHLTLADPQFHIPGPIDLLIGMDLYYDLLIDGFIKLGSQKPILQNTVFGWVASGKIGSNNYQPNKKHAHVTTMQSINEQLSRFWEIESCWTNSTLSVEDTICEEHFAANFLRDQSGRFIVTLPKRPMIMNQLGSSKEIATRRFFALEHRLQANPKLMKAYSAFIEEYHVLNHMQEITDHKDAVESSSYYMPHHGVEKEDSTTTKLRVVFDASCPTDSGVSLNQALMVGPVLQDDLLAIILRFRMHRFVVIADIEKMFRQIRIHPSDYPLQRILWRTSPSQPLRVFELTTVTYGTACAPYLATKCLQQLSKDNAEKFPLASLVLQRDFYMDDMLTGVDQEDDGEELCQQLLQLLQSAGMRLRKWSSNSPTILSKIPHELHDERTNFAYPAYPIKTLGLQWQPSDDTFRYFVPEWPKVNQISRRIVLSDTARLYDPLGLIAPVVVLAKIFVQTLWRTSRNWDEPLEESQQQHWLEFRKGLNELTSTVIPRWTAVTTTTDIIEIHGFCDASEKAYGACLYLRKVSPSGTISGKIKGGPSR